MKKLIPMLAVQCSTEFVQIIATSLNGDQQTVENLSSEDDQTLAAALQLLEDLLEFIVVNSNEDENSPLSLPSTVLLETHRCLKEAAVASIRCVSGKQFGFPDNSGIFSIL